MFSRNDTPAVDPRVDTLTETVKTLTASLQQVTEALSGMKQGQQQITQTLNQLTGQVAQVKQPIQQEPPPAEDTFKSLDQYTVEEIEQMPITQQMQIQREDTQRMIEAAVTKSVKPVQDDFNTYRATAKQDQQSANLKSLIAETGTDGKLVRPDFKDWVPDMIELQKDPSMKALPLDKLYILAKGSNPNKNAELQEKYNPKPAVKEHFGGLLSTSSQQSADKGDLSVEAASLEAIKEFGENEALIEADALDMSAS